MNQRLFFLAALLLASSVSQAMDKLPDLSIITDFFGADEVVEEAAQKPEDKRYLPNLFEQQEQDVKNFLTDSQRADEAVVLELPNDSFAGFFLPERKGKEYGSVLILPDNGQHGHWPQVIAPLREYLPDYGWNTLTISFPHAPKAAIFYQRYDDYYAAPESAAENNEKSDSAQDAESAAEESTDVAATDNPDTTRVSDAAPSEQEATEAPIDAPIKPAELNDKAKYYSEQMMARISSAYQFLINQENEQNQLVIIAYGHSAAWAANWLDNQKLPSSDNITLVLIDPQNDPFAKKPLNLAISQFDFPVLDIVTPLNQVNAVNIKKRAGVMRHNQRDMYRQVRVEGISFEREYSNAINRTVRGWLAQHLAADTALAKR